MDLSVDTHILLQSLKLIFTPVSFAHLLVESLIRVMYLVVAAILNRPFKYLNIKFCVIFVRISVH